VGEQAQSGAILRVLQWQMMCSTPILMSSHLGTSKVYCLTDNQDNTTIRGTVTWSNDKLTEHLRGLKKNTGGEVHEVLLVRGESPLTDLWRHSLAVTQEQLLHIQCVEKLMILGPLNDCSKIMFVTVSIHKSKPSRILCSLHRWVWSQAKTVWVALAEMGWRAERASKKMWWCMLLRYSRNVHPTWVRFFCNETGEVLSSSSVCEY
jgi:hypothetical protein